MIFILLKQKKIIFLMLTTSIILLACDQEKNQTTESHTTSLDEYTSVATDSNIEVLESLESLTYRIHDGSSGEEIIMLTERYLTSLIYYLGTISDLDDLESVIGTTSTFPDLNETGLSNQLNLFEYNSEIRLIIPSLNESRLDFRLIRYDATSMGFGTLERTWTFLQVVDGEYISVYPLFEASGYFPLGIKILELPNQNQIISVTGITNISRTSRQTAFIAFWEYNGEDLTQFNDIVLDDNFEIDYNFYSIHEHVYFFEFLNNIGESIIITESNEDFGFYDITGNYSGNNLMVSFRLEFDSIRKIIKRQ